jgi:hypothetical protein
VPKGSSFYGVASDGRFVVTTLDPLTEIVGRDDRRSGQWAVDSAHGSQRRVRELATNGGPFRRATRSKYRVRRG